MSSRLGGQRLASQQSQMQAIAELQTRVQQMQNEGYELLQSDETLFSVDAYVQRHWAPVK